jgi:hypothetical protein
MRGSPKTRNGLTLAAALAVTLVAVGWIRSTRRVPERAVEPAWQWNDEARVEICLSIPGAARTETGDADLLIEGTLIALGEISGDNRDVGNIVGCGDYPARFIDVRDDEKKTWRIMYALFGLGYPTVGARIGSHVRFRFYSVVHAGRTADLLLTDERGPVLAIEQGEYGPRHLEGMQLSLDWGRSLDRRPNSCGGEEVARALRVSGDTEAMVPPGQTGTVLLHGRQYRLWNARSVAVVRPACVDEDDWSSWVLWRE